MQAFLPNLNLLVAISIIVLQALCVLVVLLLILAKENKFLGFIKKHYLIIGFLITLAEVLISLFYSDIIGYAPCKLCWLQRIAIYPTCLLFLLAYIKKDRNISYYILPLTIFGSLVAIYHNYIYYFGEGIAPCDSSGVSCVQRLVDLFGGYISIPSMALTGFVSIFVLLAVNHFYQKDGI